MATVTKDSVEPVSVESPLCVREKMAEIHSTGIKSNERLQAGEFAGDFAVRYYTRQLVDQRRKMLIQAKRNKSRRCVEGITPKKRPRS